MDIPLFLFCGGPAIDSYGHPKPLMKIHKERTLLTHFLLYLQFYRRSLPQKIILLCDDGQKDSIQSEINNLNYPREICIETSGSNTNTFKKFCHALGKISHNKSVVQFGYPDIFSFDKFAEPKMEDLESNAMVCISTAVLTSRFPRLAVDIYNSEVRGISNYTSPVPANPLHIFGGDLWGRSDYLFSLADKFLHETKLQNPSLEYDFFFWLINLKKMSCVIQYGERLLVDSIRDINQLLSKTNNIL
jgi:hypothetical protein